MNDYFKYDYYRMTGKKYSFLNSRINMLFMHNLRFMYWWRKRNQNSKDILAKYKCYRYSRKYGLEIGNCKIGKGFYIGHPYNVTVNSNTVIGDNVNIHKGAVIGAENRGKRKGCPTIGNKVWIGINAVIVGSIKIGDDVLIAPNSYVNFDVPDHSIVIGNPAKIIKKENAINSYSGFLV